MKACQGKMGRVFVIRLEDGDVVPGCIERFAEENGVSVGHAVLVGGIGGGEVVVGPWCSQEMPPQPMLLPVDGALGRSGQTMSGCLRPGVETWLVGEVILYEILGVKAVRVRDAESGFSLLEPGE